jgi:hypothetical protein
VDDQIRKASHEFGRQTHAGLQNDDGIDANKVRHERGHVPVSQVYVENGANNGSFF